MSQQKIEKILVIDDEQAICELFRDMLEDHGFSVVTASDGIEGGCKLIDEKPDLVVMDLNMPSLDGHKSIKMMLARSQEMLERLPHILVVSGYLDDARDDLERMGIDYLQKPVSLAVLLEKIRGFEQSCLDASV